MKQQIESRFGFELNLELAVKAFIAGSENAAGVKKKAKNEGRSIVFIHESGLSERPHRCRTWAPWSQTPPLQYHFNWKTMSVMAVTWWNFYFRPFPSSIRSQQVVEFLSHLLRHIPGKLLVVWDGLRSHRGRQVWDFVRQRRLICLDFLPAYAPELNRNSTSYRLLPQGLRVTQPPCPPGTTADAPAAHAGHGLLGAGRALPTVTILFNAQ